MSATRDGLLVAATLGLLSAPVAYADTFAGAHYDPETDRLVVTMIYGGTNPHHTFSLQWGTCRSLGSGHDQHEIAAQVLDDQWQDAARRDFTKTVHFSLKGLECRPAEVTLHTAPRFYYTVHIPRARGHLPS